MCDKVFGGNKSKYDPVKRAEQCGGKYIISSCPFEPINVDIMSSYIPYKDGSSGDYTANKGWMSYLSLSLQGEQSYYIQHNLAKTDMETGFRYVTVDGLNDERGIPIKVYCAAFAGVVNKAATGNPRCGDLVRVTWDDGSFDYMVVGDAKGTLELGQTEGTIDGSNYVIASSAIEPIVDENCKSEAAILMREYGIWGSGTYTGNTFENSTLNHWGQEFKNIEVLNHNVLPKDMLKMEVT